MMIRWLPSLPIKPFFFLLLFSFFFFFFFLFSSSSIAVVVVVVVVVAVVVVSLTFFILFSRRWWQVSDLASSPWAYPGAAATPPFRKGHGRVKRFAAGTIGDSPATEGSFGDGALGAGGSYDDSLTCMWVITTSDHEGGDEAALCCRGQRRRSGRGSRRRRSRRVCPRRGDARCSGGVGVLEPNQRVWSHMIADHLRPFAEAGVRFEQRLESGKLVCREIY